MSNPNLPEHDLPVAFVQTDHSTEYVCFRIKANLNYKSVLSSNLLYFF